jgi:predicted amidophosphoribosyltransferase
LHWHKQLPKSAEGGPRDFDTLFANLRIKTDLPKGNLILVDDVATSGGHLKACAAGLRHFGGDVEHALCAAQTVNARPASIFSIPSHDLEA